MKVSRILRSIKGKLPSLSATRLPGSIRGFHAWRRGLIGAVKEALQKLVRNKIVVLIMSVIGIVVLFFIGRYFLFSGTFNITSVVIEGNSAVSDEFFEDRLGYLLGQNIFFIRSSDLDQEISQLSPYISAVQTEKKLPDQILLTIEERVPELYWINLAGIYLIDQDGFVLEVVSDFENLQLSDDDIDLLKGYGNLLELQESQKNDSKQETQETEGGDESEKEEEILSPQERIEEIEADRRELIARVDTFWKNKMNSLEAMSSYPIVFSYEKKDYQTLAKIEQNQLLATEVVVGIDFLGEDISKYVWESDFRFVIYLNNWRRIVFSSKKDVEKQVDELRILLDELHSKNETFAFVDLGGDLIVYEVE